MGNDHPNFPERLTTMFSAESSVATTAAIVDLGLFRPTQTNQLCKPGTLLAFDGRLFSFEELLARVSARALWGACDSEPQNPMEW